MPPTPEQHAAYGQKCVTCGKTQEDGRHGDVTGGHDFIASAAYRSRVVTIGFHRHRVECSCGYSGPTRVVPADAEKDREGHRHGD